MHWLLFWAVLLYVLWFIVVFGGQEYLIFPRALWPRPFTPVERPPVESVWLTMDDGTRVEAWYSPGAGRSAQSPGPAVMYFHGSGNLIDTRWELVQPYVDSGISALTMEYRGYGRTRGVPCETRLVSDATQFYDWLRQRPEVGAAPIILSGQSIGAAVAAALAAKRPAGALILESAFTSMEDMATRFLLPRWLCRNLFQTEKVLRKLEVPVLICHGQGDWLVPLEQARRLKKLARKSALVVLDCGHADFISDWEHISEFLALYGVWPAAAPVRNEATAGKAR